MNNNRELILTFILTLTYIQIIYKDHKKLQQQTSISTIQFKREKLTNQITYQIFMGQITLTINTLHQIDLIKLERKICSFQLLDLKLTFEIGAIKILVQKLLSQKFIGSLIILNKIWVESDIIITTFIYFKHSFPFILYQVKQTKMIKATFIFLFFIFSIKSLFVIVYVQSNPLKGIKVVKKSNSYTTSIDDESFNKITRFRNQVKAQVSRSSTKTAPDISMIFQQLSLPHSIKTSLQIMNGQKYNKIFLYMNIIITVKPINQIIKPQIIPCVYLFKKQETKIQFKDDNSRSCLLCYQGEQTYSDINTLEKQLNACISTQKAHQYLKSWLKRSKTQISSENVTENLSSYLRTFYKIVAVIIFVIIMIIKYRVYHPNKFLADI